MDDVKQPQTAPDGAPRVAEICDVDLSLATTFSAGPPHEAFDTLRAVAPIAWQDEKPPPMRSSELKTGIPAPPSPGFWAVTSHELVSEISKTPEMFSSYLGGTQMFSADEVLLSGLRLMLLYMDPPEQTRLRKILTPAFRPAMVESMRASIEKNAQELGERIARSGTVDLVQTVTRELPTRILATLLGMPDEDRDLIPAWSDALIGAESAELSGDDLSKSFTASLEMNAYGTKIFNERRADPRDDLVSALATAEVDGEQLTVDEFCMIWLLLVVAGNETTRNSMSNAVVALLEHGLWEPLAQAVARGENPIDDQAVNELVRYISPVMHFRRTATRDLELGGQLVRAGDKVIMWYGAANRDPAVFADPHAIDLKRDPNPHLAFGLGPHFCLGSRVARLQIATMLTELLGRYPNLKLAGEPTRVASTFINGIAALPVTVG